MSAKTQIDYLDSAWNFVVGCTPAGPECLHCYARRTHERRHKAYLAGKKMPAQYAKPFSEVQCIESRLEQPLHWGRIGVDCERCDGTGGQNDCRNCDVCHGEGKAYRSRRIGVCFGGDLFHPDVPDAFLDRAFAVMANHGGHTFHLLTKRPERMKTYVSSRSAEAMADLINRGEGASEKWARDTGVTGKARDYGLSWPIPNLWLGTSVGLRSSLHRIDTLRAIPAAHRFVSFEPLLEDLGQVNLEGISWAAIGGETHQDQMKARPCAIEWIDNLGEQCHAAGVPYFVKQYGTFVVSEERACATDEEAKREFGFESRWLWRAGLTDGRGADPDQWGDRLVRQLPEVQQ